ncbi:MAG: hypothetical protein K0B06_03295 [Brevefilum sp.]|nr:hypothetical protein [Brevefilum sp.]
MLTKLSNSLLKFSTGPLTLACLAIFLIFGALVLPDQAARAEVYSAEAGSPDTSLYYTASDLYRMAEAYGPAGRAAYIRARFTFDLLFPLVYTAFLVTAISWLVKRADLPWGTLGRLNLLPVAGMLFDFLENISAVTVMSRYPQTTAVIDQLAGGFTLIKWNLISASFIALIVLGIIALVRWVRTRQKSSGQ